MCDVTVQMTDCPKIPYANAVKVQVELLPHAVEEAIRTGYGPFRTSLPTTAGTNERNGCGGFLVDQKRRLVITSLHCLPDYSDLVQSKYMLFRGIPATKVAYIDSIDLVLLWIDSIPAGMQQVEVTEAVVGEPVYGRSWQEERFLDVTESKVHPRNLFFEGDVNFTGSVASKGEIKTGEEYTGDDTHPPLDGIQDTPYEVLRLDGAAEPGFSGSPVYNEWGQVVGIFCSISNTSAVTYAISSADFKPLLDKYKGN